MNATWATGVLHVATLGLIRERPICRRREQPRPVDRDVADQGNVHRAGRAGGVTLWPMQLFSRSGDPFHTLLAELFRVTAMRGLASTAPLYVYHGTFEWWVPAAGTREFVAEQCHGWRLRRLPRIPPAEHFGSAFMGFPAMR